MLPLFNGCSSFAIATPNKALQILRAPPLLLQQAPEADVEAPLVADIDLLPITRQTTVPSRWTHAEYVLVLLRRNRLLWCLTRRLHSQCGS